MSDGVTIPATGSGTATPVISTDDVGGAHIQRVKLTDGTDGSSTAIPGDASGLTVQGGTAADSADAGNPLKIGGKAVELKTNPSTVSANDRVNALFDRNGLQFHIGGHPNIITFEITTTQTSTNAVLIAGTASVAMNITNFQALLDEACTVGVGFRAGFGTTVPSSGINVVASHPGMVPGAGINRGDGSAVIAISSSGQGLRVTNDTTNGAELRYLISYFDTPIG